MSDRRRDLNFACLGCGHIFGGHGNGKCPDCGHSLKSTEDLTDLELAEFWEGEGARDDFQEVVR